MSKPGCGHRITVDTGGTFTDVTVLLDEGRLFVGKALTTPDRMSSGILAALEQVAEAAATDREQLLSATDLLIYATTHATNAILEQKTARTAFVTTAGFRDILLLREGGRPNAYDFSTRYEPGYVPRSLTFEIGGRIGAGGKELAPLAAQELEELVKAIASASVDAVGVCLLWSVANTSHELAVGNAISRALPDVAVTLSHTVSSALREYRRASATVIDASLRPLMTRHYAQIEGDLRVAGLAGRLLGVTAAGGCMDIEQLTRRPIHSVGSGPSMAPTAALAATSTIARDRDLIVCDAGGTTYDVSLVANRTVRRTREAWLGPRWQGHILGVPTVEVTSIGAGGGSIAHVDAGGLLRVGPRSAGAIPGPACYGRGGRNPTLTDAALVLGYLNPDHPIGDGIQLDPAAAGAAIRASVAEPLKLSLEAAADAIVTVATDAMAEAIRRITVAQGVDPRECAMVAGGGAGGLNAARIAKELGIRDIVVPAAAGALSAWGAQHADVVADFSLNRPMRSDDADPATLDDLGKELATSARAFLSAMNGTAPDAVWEYSVEARYPDQIWDIEVPLETHDSLPSLRGMEARFHQQHHKMFAVSQPDRPVDCHVWRLQLTVPLARPRVASVPATHQGGTTERSVWFDGAPLSTNFGEGAGLPEDSQVRGPWVIADPNTTVIVPPWAAVRRTAEGHYLLELLDE